MAAVAVGGGLSAAFQEITMAAFCDEACEIRERALKFNATFSAD